MCHMTLLSRSDAELCCGVARPVSYHSGAVDIGMVPAWQRTSRS